MMRNCTQRQNTVFFPANTQCFPDAERPGASSSRAVEDAAPRAALKQLKR
jgi:hypothetical protein